MSAKRVERVALGRLVLRPSVRPCKWSLTSPAGLAGPARPRPPGGPVGCFPGRERGKSAGGGAARSR
eukprot:gene12441-biopygen6017